MTAGGELFINEDLRDVAFKEIEKRVSDKYGNETQWQINANHYGSIYNKADLPKKVYGDIIINLRNGQQRLVGKIHASLIFEVEGEEADKYIQPDIEEWQLEMFKKPKMWK